MDLDFPYKTFIIRLGLNYLTRLTLELNKSFITISLVLIHFAPALWGMSQHLHSWRMAWVLLVLWFDITHIYKHKNAKTYKYRDSYKDWKTHWHLKFTLNSTSSAPLFFKSYLLAELTYLRISLNTETQGRLVKMM